VTGSTRSGRCRICARDRLATLNTTRTASHQIVRHSLTWRRRAGLVVAERERADQLDLLAGSCLMLARTATDVKGEPRRQLTATVRRLAAVIDDLAKDPGDPVTRERAAERAVEFARWLVQHGGRVPAQSALAAACAGVRMIAIDVMVYAGVDPEQAFDAAGAGPPADH
jgi:hypothetical protein